ncbi:MAG: EpsG family protein [Prevotella sp.]|nr:EpsG family protein [Prevotella sp.]
MMIFVVGLRYHIGSDTVVYEWNFNTSYTPYFDQFLKDWNEKGQPLWWFVMSFCKTYFHSFVAVQFFHAIVYNIFLMKFIKRMTKWHFTALLIAFALIWFANSFEVLRESISAVIYMNALFFLYDKKYLKYILMGVLASGFHSFAFIIFILTPFVVKLNYKFLLTLFALIFVGIRFIDTTVINQALVVFSSLMSDSVSDKMALYIGQENSSIISLLGLLRSLFLNLLLPLLVLKYTDSNKDFYKKLLLLWMIFASMTTKIPILYRFENYLTMIYVVLLVNMLYERKIVNHLLHTLSVWLTVGTVLMGFWDVYRPSPMEYRSNIHYDCRYFPYKTIFQDPDPIREGLDYYH